MDLVIAGHIVGKKCEPRNPDPAFLGQNSEKFSNSEKYSECFKVPKNQKSYERSRTCPRNSGVILVTANKKKASLNSI